MSWVDKELKRREAMSSRLNAAQAGKSGRSGDSKSSDDGGGIESLWEQFEALNQALPDLLKLRRDLDRQDGLQPNTPAFRVWLMATNGAGLGFNGEGIRYVWPVEGRRRSNNFWIRWDEQKGYRLTQRKSSSWAGPSIKEYAFKPKTTDHIVKCLVVGVRIKSKTVCKRRWWWPF